MTIEDSAEPTQVRVPPSIAAIGALVLVVDALALLGNVLFIRSYGAHPVFSDPRWNGDTDGSVVELIGYVQLAAALVGLLRLAVRDREALYLAWAAVFAWLLADDALLLHERLGGALVVALNLPAPFGFDSQYLGEALVWAAAIPVLAMVLLITWRRAPTSARRNTRALFWIVALLAFFAVAVDTVVIVAAAYLSPLIETYVVFAETTGELLTLSLALLAVLLMVRSPRR